MIRSVLTERTFKPIQNLNMTKSEVPLKKNKKSSKSVTKKKITPKS